jgi:UPF0176 protein
MTQNDYIVAIYYKFFPIQDPEAERVRQRYLCEKLGLKGRILISEEGINGTVEGTNEAINKYVNELKQDQYFEDVYFKQSPGSGAAFPKLVVKVRDEIVTTKLEYSRELGPIGGKTAQYISKEELNKLFQTNQEFYIVDMRNDFEYEVGHFEKSVFLKNMRNFRDLPKILPDIEHLKDKKVVTVCTSGIRCEKASGFLLHHGFSDVYQLKDGIMEYMQTYPNEHFHGKLYVFDQRVVIGFNTDSPKHEVVGTCKKCGAKSENLVDHREDGKRKYQVVCEECIRTGQVVLD